MRCHTVRQTRSWPNTAHPPSDHHSSTETFWGFTQHEAVNRTPRITIRLGGGVFYLQNKHSWPLCRTGRSFGCTCAERSRFLSSCSCHLGKSQAAAQLPRVPHTHTVNLGVYRKIWSRVAGGACHQRKQQHLSAL